MLEENEKIFKDNVPFGAKKKWNAFESMIEEGEQIVSVCEGYTGKDGTKDCIFISTDKKLYIMYSELMKYRANVISIKDIVEVEVFYIKKMLLTDPHLNIKIRKENGEIIKKTYKLLSGEKAEIFVEKMKSVIGNENTKESENVCGLFNDNGSQSKADMLLKLKELLDSGILTEEEFKIEKEKIMKM